MIKFGEYLVQKKKISVNSLATAVQVSKYYKEKIGRILCEMNLLKPEELNQELAQFSHSKLSLNYSDLAEKLKETEQSLSITSDLRNKIKDSNCLIYEQNEEEKKLTLLGPKFNDQLIQSLEKSLQMEIELKTIERTQFDLLWQEFNTLNKDQKTNQSLIVGRDLTDEEKLQANDPYSKIIKSCLDNARDFKASDIHFEPFEEELLVRFRVHGQLSDWKRFSFEHIRPLTAKLKYLVNMDLATIGRPQDSRATFTSLKIDIRGSSMPVTNGGEKIVLRLQYQDQSLSIHDLGIRERTKSALLNSISKNVGLILISGPTGSGKTTTLYALLEEMDRLGKNISTLENPVEKKLARINQANVSNADSFDDFQRALMRQDPDVILLGEIRDSETAKLAIKLSGTGHLVLSTIHANGAVEVIDRLENLGIDYFSLKSNLRLSVAQRLVRRICSFCSKDAPTHLVSKFHNDEVKVGIELKLKIKNPHGCDNCHKGVSGRVAVIEYLDKEDLTNNPHNELFVKCTLEQECLRLAQLGHIDVEEALSFKQ